MSRYIFLWIGILWFGTISVVGAEVIRVSATQGDATPRIQAAIEKARQYRGKPVVIRLEQGNYHLFRTSCSKQVYYISNTASEEENPDPTKHIGLWIRGIRNLTIEGDGARLVTHGEMTSFVIDSSENIILRNFTLTAADPSVPEMTVVDAGENYLTARIHPDSPYEIREGKFTWLGEGWNFTGGIAQVFEPWRNVTWRCNSPMSDVVKAIELEKGLVRFNYNKRPEGRVGQVFQMRDAIRDEVCGLILKSKQVTLEDLNIHFLGNFGIVGQYSENLTYNRLNCTPEWGHGRTCAGFADFVQMSGCRGKVSILDSRFEGAQDDPINIHGTHLKVMDFPASNQVRVRFMHNQSFGFEAFFKGDEVELVQVNSLRKLQSAWVKQVKRLDNYEILLTLDRPVDEQVKQQPVVVENVTWTPEVLIRNNYFSRIPTRGILVTTRRKVVIEKNIFFRTPMSAILISDDARSWYESGPVSDVTIRNNFFVECGSPVISIAPENDRPEGAVHRNIRILANRFALSGKEGIYARWTEGLDIRDNYFEYSEQLRPEDFIRLENCESVQIENNRSSLK